MDNHAEYIYNLGEKLKKLSNRKNEIIQEIDETYKMMTTDIDKPIEKWFYNGDDEHRIDFFFAELYDRHYNGFRGFGFSIIRDEWVELNLKKWINLYIFQVYHPAKKALLNKYLKKLDKLKGVFETDMTKRYPFQE